MKNRLSFVALFGALALGGCPTPVHPPVCGVDIICPDDTGTTPDSGVPVDANRDAARAPDTGPMSCSSSGRVGAHCRMGSCSTGLSCPMLVTGMTIQQVFMLRQGTIDDPMHMGYQGVEDPALPANSAPFNGLSGGVCVQVCDTTAATDGCGTCATCSTILTQMPLVNAFGGALSVLGTADRTYGADSGICRLDCMYDPAARGAECPDDMTCDAFSSVCIEQCTSDSECNTAYGATYSGELVTIVGAENPRVCNMTTGRCEQTGTAGANVGDACDSAADCAPGTGICLNGGMCGELGCDMLNCGTGGLCLGINDHSTLCLAGCNTTADCEPGNACSPLTAAMGGFNGYCIGVCGDDSECRATETCTDFVDDMGMPQNGQCVNRCTMVDAIGVAAGCEADQYCRRDHDGAAYGYCRALGAFCTVDMTPATPGASADCGAGQICDELLATGGGAGFGGRDIFGDGHCVNACTADADCAGLAGTTCQLTGPYAGLCRTACSASVPCTSANEMCDTANSVCTEIPPPA
jgi:hypothetical protein